MNVTFMPLKAFVEEGPDQRPDLKAAFAKDAKGEVMMLHANVTAPHLKAKGQVLMAVAPIDVNGPLVLTAKAADAPIIHFGGPLAVSFFMEIPSFRRERTAICVLAVGTHGLGTGTFATIGYEGVIPESVYPTAEITYAPLKAGSPPVKTLYELKERC